MDSLGLEARKEALIRRNGRSETMVEISYEYTSPACLRRSLGPANMDLSVARRKS